MKRKRFEDCLGKNQLIAISKDYALAKELLLLAEHREMFWKEANLEEKYPSLYLEGHYEIIKELGTAILALEGWKALDHECLFAYLLHEKTSWDIDFQYLLELKDIRNSIDYRGTIVHLDLWKRNKLKIMLIIKALKEHIKEMLDDTK